MSREIIFRQWVDGRFRYWGYVVQTDKGVFPTEESFASPVIGIPSEQYTGLTDCNGVKVFQGDIIADKEDAEIFGYDGAKFEIFCSNSVLFWFYKKDDELFQIKITDGSYKNWEVIGNIHEGVRE